MESRPRPAGAERALRAILTVGLVVIPVLYSSGMDVFRLPKELAFRAEAFLLFAVLAWRFTRVRVPWLVTAAVAWTAIAAIFSTNRALSLDSLITVVAAAVIFIATLNARASIVVVDAMMAGACANAALAILQELKIWTPFAHEVEDIGHYGSVGFLGNANDVGMFLAPAALAAFVVAAIAEGRRRWIYAAICALLFAGLVATATRTAIGALMVGLVLFGVRHSRRAAIGVAAVLVVVVLLALSPRTTLGVRAREITAGIATRNYERVLSERMLPFLAAIDMARDHPLLGVGPGCFHYHFMHYRLALDDHYPKEWTRGYPGNWGAVHNDHLQVAAETGLPGYALFLAAIVVVAWRRRETSRPRDLETSFARAMPLPFAALVFVLCLAQFPLQVAAPRLLLLMLAALCIAWSEGDA
jgi:O-Antigen ligase